MVKRRGYELSVIIADVKGTMYLAGAKK